MATLLQMCISTFQRFLLDLQMEYFDSDREKM